MHGLNQILCRIKHVTIAPCIRLYIDQHMNYIPQDINCVRLLSQQETIYVAVNDPIVYVAVNDPIVYVADKIE